jgi:PKD repeat protein
MVMKRSGLVLIIFLATTLAIYAQTNVELYTTSVVDYTKIPGTTVSIDVSIKNAPVSEGWEFKLRYNLAVLIYDSYTPGPIFDSSDWWITASDGALGLTVGCMAMYSGVTFSGDVTLVTLKFSVRPYGYGASLLTLSEGSLLFPSSPVTFSYTNGIFCNSAPPVLSFSMSPAKPMAGQPVTFDATRSFVPDGGRIVEYKWMPEGSSGPYLYGPIVTHTYGSAGDYIFKVEISSENYNETIYMNLDVTVAEYAPPSPGRPVAKFTMNPYVIFEGDTITFDASNSYDPDGDELSYEWDFGDGQTATGMIVTHTYSASAYNVDYPRDYTVKLTVSDPYGNSNYAYQLIAINKRPLIMIRPAPLVRDTQLTFDATGLSNYSNVNGLKGPITGFLWDFGSTSTTAGITAIHAYSQSGTHTVSLTITDAYDNSSTISFEINVYYPIDVAFKADPNPVKEGQKIIFDASEVATRNPDGVVEIDPDGRIVGYNWDFGDGQEGEGVLIEHSYSQSGKYQVTLTIIDEYGVKETGSLTITVGHPPFAAFSISSESIIIGQEVQFDASESISSNGAIIRYEWDFGDGTKAQGIKVTHLYSQEGHFNVTLKITDEIGFVDTVIKVIKVVEERPRGGGGGGCGLLGIEILLLLMLLKLTRLRK